MKQDLIIASVFIGTIIGAGLASGQEILQFFSFYGIKGFLGIMLCCMIYIFTSFIIINLCFKLNFKSYKEIIYSALGNKIGIFVDAFLTFFIFSSNIIMISGGGAMLNEYIGIDKAVGILIMASMVLIIGFFSTKGVFAVNAVIVPLSTISIIVLGFFVLRSFNSIYEIHMVLKNILPVRKTWFLSTILYSSFNIMCAAGVLCPMMFENKNRLSFIRGCILGSIMLTLISFIISLSILLYYPQSFRVEIPNLYIAKQFGRVLPFFLSAVIWLEMFSTEISSIYSLSKRITNSFNIPYYFSVLIVVVVSVPFTFIGFSNLIRFLYPPFGAVSFIFVLGCIKKYFSLKFCS